MPPRLARAGLRKTSCSFTLWLLTREPHAHSGRRGPQTHGCCVGRTGVWATERPPLTWRRQLGDAPPRGWAFCVPPAPVTSVPLSAVAPPS